MIQEVSFYMVYNKKTKTYTKTRDSYGNTKQNKVYWKLGIARNVLSAKSDKEDWEIHQFNIENPLLPNKVK